MHVCLSISCSVLYQKLWINICINISGKKLLPFSVLQICLEKVILVSFEQSNVGRRMTKFISLTSVELSPFYDSTYLYKSSFKQFMLSNTPNLRVCIVFWAF